jgi:hypothetical protein
LASAIVPLPAGVAWGSVLKTFTMMDLAHIRRPALWTLGFAMAAATPAWAEEGPALSGRMAVETPKTVLYQRKQLAPVGDRVRLASCFLW